MEQVTREQITLTPKAIQKVKELITQQAEQFDGLRVRVVGGGCSGFQYQLYFDSQDETGIDHVLEFDGLKVIVDQQSLLYINGTEIDYVEGLHQAGFKFNNPNVKGSCGCGESFSV